MKKTNIKNYGWLYVISTFIFTSFFFPRASLATINIPWSTTFNCAESTQYNGTLCDGLTWGGAWFFGDYRTQITSAANNPNGRGGRGARFWVGDGVNKGTGTITVTFTSPQKELWIRWYMRYEAGFQWSKLYYDKNLYIHTGGTHGTSVIPEFHYDKYVVIAQSTPDYYQVKSTNDGGWSSIMGGEKSDGKFHAYEIHLKMDKDGYDGKGQLWIDGILQASNNSVNWSNENATARQGWVWFQFNSNQNNPNNSRAAYVDYDDIAIYNSTPPKRDADGNPFIGLLDTPVRRTLASDVQVLPPKNFLLVK